MHSSADIDTNNEKKKRKIVLFYNANKVGVDCFDQMNLLYTKISATQRLPLAVWGNNLDIVAINSWIHFKKVRKESVTSREFILMLIEILINKQSKVSYTKTNLKIIHQVVRKQRKCHRKCCENNSAMLHLLSETNLWKMFSRQFQIDLREMQGMHKNYQLAIFTNIKFRAIC